MDGLSIAGSVAGLVSLGIQVTQTLVDFYSAYKDQNSDIAYALRKLSNLIGVLESLRAQTSRMFHVDEKNLLSSIEASVNGCELLIKELQQETEKFQRAGSIQVAARTAAYRATYPFRRSTLLKLEENIDETVAHLSLALQVLGQKQNSSVQDHIGETKELLALIRSDQLSSKIQKWLKAPDASVNYNQACAKCHPGTGLWFVKGAMFDSWLTDRNSRIWLSGFAGCGKSVLCSTAIRAFDEVYILLDALDESPRNKHRMDVLQALVDIQAWQEPGLHILITSRDEIDIREGLNVPQSQILFLKNKSIDSDIASFISKRLRESKKIAIEKWSEHFDQIETALANGANGVFRWVECQFSALESCPKSKRQLDRLLSSLPRSLDKTYERMLLNINEEYIEDASRVLSLLTCAKRPLTVLEVIEAVAVELGDSPALNPDGRLLDGDEILRLCPGFLELAACSRSGKTTVRISHFSVQEYLESERLHPTLARFKVHRPEAHAQIASICLTYLMEPQGSNATSSTEYPLRDYSTTAWHQHYRDADSNLHQVEDQAMRFFQLTGSAFRIWAKDYSGSARLVSPVFYASYLGLASLLSRLLEERRSNCSIYRKRLPDIDTYINAQNGRDGTALQAASKQGHEAVVRILLGEGANVNTVNPQDPDYSRAIRTRAVYGPGIYATALEAASAEGHEEVVRLLLDHGAKIDNGNQSSLYMASRNNHEAIVELLLKKGIDADAAGRFSKSPLQVASSRGHHGVIQLLLDHGANIDLISEDGQTAIGAASSRGLEATIQLLLRRGGDINANRGIALEAALEAGHEDAVRLLLDRGARINIQRKSLLALASEGGHEAIIHTLLDKGAEIDGNDGDGRPLRIALRKGHDAIAVLLLGRGANVNAQHRYNATALQEASERGDKAIVQLLLEKGANINAQSDWFRGETALDVALAKGDLEMIQLLLYNGANIDIPGGRTLQRACSRGDKAMAQLLIDKGAHVNQIADGYTGTALEEASAGGHEEIVQLLLNNGADINVDGGGLFSIPLHVASSGGHEATVRMLLANGADVDFRDTADTTALYRASERGHEAVVRLLLDKGAEINAIHTLGETALHVASKEGHEAIVRLLLARGSEINAKSRHGETAVRRAISEGHETLAELLLNEGANVQLDDKHDGYALWKASRDGYKTIVGYLLDRKPGANAKLAASLNEALHAAAENGHEEIVRQLIVNGANPNIKSGMRGLTTLAAASAIGHEAIVRLLLDNRANVDEEMDQSSRNTALEAAAEHGHQKIVQLLLSHGAKVDIKRGNALCFACSNGHEGVVRLLLDKGADLNARGYRDGRNSLEEALAAGNTAVARVLIDRGVDIKLRLPESRFREGGYEEMVQVLLDAIAMRACGSS
ncbi:unnamed protein product [Clonostachys rosea]|uniref:Fungal N-terminal domain-containing protein n=1 Tax=Bionectria ochroleuca TaxID=29856 RepID=A0ABY6TWF4_BIOOC|nr:unnamed protein product [Clonostachys rosea]